MVLVGLGILGYWTYQNYFAPVQPDSDTASPTPIATESPTVNWKTYTNQKYGYQFKYPQESALNDQSEQYVAVSYMGEKQKASGRTQTELFDGYAFNVADISDDKYDNLDDLYEAKKIQLQEICTSVGDPKETTIGGFRAIMHRLSCLGDSDTYYVQKGKVFFEIGLLSSGDAEDLPKYTSVVNQILSTFKFTQ